MIFRFLNLCLLCIFYFVYLRKMISQKKSGIRTDQLGVGKTGFCRFIEIGLKILSMVTVSAEFISLIFVSKTDTKLGTIGVIITGLGVVFFCLAVQTMKDSWRAGVTEEKTNLVTEGIFQYSRNPAFLGFDLTYLGTLLVVYNPVLFVISCFSVLFFHLQIVNNEEDHMLVEFGDDYLNYKKTVCRYFGRKLVK